MAALVSVGLAVASSPAPAVSQESGNPIDEKGFELLPRPIWSAERERRCGLITVAEARQYAGLVVTTTLELKRGTALMSAWHFYDPQHNLTLTQQGAACFTNVKLKRPQGNYRFDFTLPLDPVSFDPTVNAAASADPAFLACRSAHPEKLASAVVVSVLVDADDSLFVSAGTRNVDNLRDCLGKALAAALEPQVKGGTFALARPAVVTATLPVAPASPVGN